MSGELVVAVVGLCFVVMSTVASAVWAVARAQGFSERLATQIQSLVLEIEALRRDFREFTHEMRRTLMDHEKRLGDFEGGRSAWLALRDKNGSGD